MGLGIIGGVVIGIVAAVGFFIWLRKKNPPR
jgi:hypothetical protein